MKKKLLYIIFSDSGYNIKKVIPNYYKISIQQSKKGYKNFSKSTKVPKMQPKESTLSIFLNFLTCSYLGNFKKSN